MLLRARHYATGQPIEVVVHNGVIDSIRPTAEGPADTHTNPKRERGPADFEAQWIAPGTVRSANQRLRRLQFQFGEADRRRGRHVVPVCRQHGIAGLCPTLVTSSFTAIAHGLTTIRRRVSRTESFAQAIGGIHVEGPYIAAEDGPRGAHPLRHVRPPDWDEFRRWQDSAGGRIRLLTLAPELPGAIAFIEKLTAAGVVVALGHTAAKSASIQAAIAAGARLSTHLGNGSHAMLPRHDNYIWEQLAADELCGEHHLRRPSSAGRRW